MFEILLAVLGLVLAAVVIGGLFFAIVLVLVGREESKIAHESKRWG